MRSATVAVISLINPELTRGDITLVLCNASQTLKICVALYEVIGSRSCSQERSNCDNKSAINGNRHLFDSHSCEVLIILGDKWAAIRRWPIIAEQKQPSHDNRSQKKDRFLCGSYSASSS